MNEFLIPDPPVLRLSTHVVWQAHYVIASVAHRS